MRFRPEIIQAILKIEPRGSSALAAFLFESMPLVAALPGSTLTLGRTKNSALLKVVRPTDPELYQDLAPAYAQFCRPVPEKTTQILHFDFFWPKHFATEVTNQFGRQEYYIFPYGFARPLAEFYTQPVRPKRDEFLRFIRTAEKAFRGTLPNQNLPCPSNSPALSYA